MAILSTWLMLCLWVASAADAQQTVITSAGPMTQISLADDLSCQVQMANDATGVFYTGSVPGACGTYLQIGSSPFTGNVFGPTVPLGDPSVTADFVPDPQHPQTLAQSGSTYTVTTTADACTSGTCAAGNGSMAAVLTETDTYVVGDDFYSTSLAINNVSDFTLSGTIYHTGDCYLEGDQGYGALAGGNAPECTLSPNNSPAGRVVSFVPGAGPSPSAYYEGAFDSFWTDITTTGTPYPNTIDATTLEDNGLGLSWPYSVQGGGTTTISYTTLVSPAQAPANTTAPVISGTPAVGQTLTCSQGTWSGSGPITYTYQWLQGGNPIGGETNNSYVVQSGDQGQALTCQVTADNGIGSPASQTSASINVPPATPVSPTAPSVSPQPPTVNPSQAAAFSATVNPDGSATTVYFEYGPDPKYGLTTAASLYVQRTPNQVVSAGSAPQVVIATVTGLVPHALYHVRVVASNAVGSVKGSDQTFTTTAVPAPPPPVLGRQADFAPSAGVVYIKPPSGAHVAALQAGLAASATTQTKRGRGFVPLTQALQLPVGTQVDARNGTLKVTTATTVTKRGKRTQTQSGEFSKGLFQVLQSGKGKLKGTTVLELLDTGIFPGAPSYKTECGAVGKLTRQTWPSDGRPIFRRRRLSNRALQTLFASEHGNYRTQGRYSAATVRGTVFTVTDRCDGTLTHVVHGTVVVADLHRHRKITVHAGHRYLAKAP